jgi:hypothetical protein
VFDVKFPSEKEEMTSKYCSTEQVPDEWVFGNAFTKVQDTLVIYYNRGSSSQSQKQSPRLVSSFQLLVYCHLIQSHIKNVIVTIVFFYDTLFLIVAPILCFSLQLCRFLYNTPSVSK